MLENNIKILIKILEQSNIDEMEVSTFWGKQKIRIRKNAKINSEDTIELINHNSKTTTVDTSDYPHNIESQNEPAKVERENSPLPIVDSEHHDNVYIKAPLVGTFYLSSKPGEPPFISEGTKINKGQVICIIEAMKIFNEIESEFSGKVEKILINDNTPVEYDQDLIVISPE